MEITHSVKIMREDGIERVKISKEEADKGWDNWVKVYGEDFSYYGFFKFIGLPNNHSIKILAFESGYLVPVEAAHRMRLLASPHHKAIIIAWMIVYTEPSVEASG